MEVNIQVMSSKYALRYLPPWIVRLLCHVLLSSKHEIDAIDVNTNQSNFKKSLEIENIWRVDGNEITYNDFFVKCLLPNRPCIIENVGKHWPASTLWATANKAPNTDHLVSRYKDAQVSVAQCDKQMYNAQKKDLMTFGDYISQWSSGIAHENLLYLKDWHFFRDFPKENVYTVPKFFCSDWLNEYYTGNIELLDDYRFVYMGPKGSWTPLHSDVFQSYSWSINITGQKRWLLLEPGVEKYFLDAQKKIIFSKWLEPPKKLSGVYEIIQEAGDAIFVPSGWYHQVWNMKDTISINHNWINATNINFMWQSMKSNLSEIKEEIKDCQDMAQWDDHCQLMLKTLYGMDFKEFQTFLQDVILNRMQSIEQNKELTVFGHAMGKNLLLFDIEKALQVLKLLKNEQVVCFGEAMESCWEDLIIRIQKFVDDSKLK